MTETPKFLRFARALAVGAAASTALLQCTPAATTPTSEPSSGSSTSEPSSGSSPQPLETTTPTGTATAIAGALVRTGDRCELVGTAHYRIEGRSLISCGCDESTGPNGATARAWVCTSFERSAGGLDGRECSDVNESRNDDGGPPGNLCFCVATAQRPELACYHAFQMAAGPQAPPELAA
jgi:hypothetical protein